MKIFTENQFEKSPKYTEGRRKIVKDQSDTSDTCT